MNEAEREMRRGVLFANAMGYGIVWGAAGLAWAGAGGQSLIAGLLVGVAVGVVGAALTSRSMSPSAFGGLGSILAVVGAIVWLATK